MRTSCPGGSRAYWSPFRSWERDRGKILFVSHLSRYLPAALSLLLIAALGFLAKFYAGPGRVWVNDSFAGVFYVVFWCVLAAVVFSRAGALRIAAIIVIVTSGLEVLQLWHPPFLESIRSTFPGRMLLGTSFVFSEFFYYVLGGVVGFVWIVRLRSSETRPEP